MAYIRIIISYGIYHIYNIGQNGMFIFPTNLDKAVFLNMLREAQIKFGFEIYAYSIMSNHYHLLFKDNGRQISKIIGLVQENYAIYYNAKYGRKGAVFMKPFKSKPISTKGHFFIVLSYILNNPVKAGIKKVYNDYKWNSPLLGYEKQNLTDYLYVKHYFKPVMGVSLHRYIVKQKNRRKIADIEINIMSNAEAEKFFNNIVLEYSGNDVFSSDQIDKDIQREIIAEAKYQGLTTRQLANFTGKSQSTIQRIKIRRSYI